jgi:hypothetical protein
MAQEIVRFLDDIEESIFLSGRIYVMNSQPGRITAEIKVPLPRPRGAEMTSNPEFINLVQELKELIREESPVAMGPDLITAGPQTLAWTLDKEQAEFSDTHVSSVSAAKHNLRTDARIA